MSHTSKVIKRNAMFSLGIEVTRRCNMNCSFCARGKAQNMDITKEIIDKTLDEIQLNDVYVNEVRFNGGEPTLNPEAIEYTIDGIIKRKLLVRSIACFTNGTILSERIRDALIRFVKYRHSMESEIAIEAYHQGFMVESVYNNAGVDGLGIVISEHEHNNTDDDVEKCMKFYDYDDDYFTIVRQKDTFSSIGTITVSGNVLDNYKQLFGKKVLLNQIRKINNRYILASQYNQRGKAKYYVDKTISVSANGNVFAGCISSYDDIDAAPMFNILSCNGNFIDEIIEWCWKYPVGNQVKNFREKYEAMEWCEKHGICVADVSKNERQLVSIVYKLTQAEEKIALDLHEICPNLNPSEINALAGVTLMMNMIENNSPKNWIEKYLRTCSEYDEETIRLLIGEREKALGWIRGFILFLAEKDKNRNREKKELVG